MSTTDYCHSPRTLLHIAAELQQRGVSPLELFKRLDIPPSRLLDEQRWVPRDLCFALSEACAEVVGDSLFISRVGENYRLTDLGVWGQTIVEAPTVGDACSAAAKGVGLLHQGSSLQFIHFHRHAELRLSYDGRLGADPGQHLIGTLAVLRKIALLGKAPEAVEVRFTMPLAHGAEAFEETHGCRLAFGCDHDSIVVDRDLLTMPLKTGHQDLSPPAPGPAETAESIGRLLGELLPYAQANIQTVAERLHVSPRTVQRRLKEWGFSFEEILDDVRRTKAVEYLRSGQLTALETAYLLGYSDPAHFTRAFRRWTGVPPRVFLQNGKRFP